MKLIARRPLAAVLVLAAATSARAQAPTLKTISIDGDHSDWQEVLLNPVQVTLDGDSSSLPCEVSTDRDCPVQAVGRDARVLAWTHDDDALYVLVRRQGSSDNESVAWLYLDRTGADGRPDGLMGSGDVVLRVRHQGRTGVTTNALYPYLPADPAGDPMVDADGLADGYTLPGTLVEPALWLEGLPNGGGPEGLAFEERVPWSALGVAAGTPVSFHVSTSNDPLPENVPRQVDDNLGGPDGGAGSLSVALIEVDPDGQAAVLPGGSVVHLHELRNAGTSQVRCAVAVTSTLGLSVTLSEDADGDGTFETVLARDANGDGDFSDVGDELLRDEDGDGFPEVPLGPELLAPGEARGLAVELQTRPGQDGMRDVTVLTAWVIGRESVRSDATDVTWIGDVVLRAPDPDRTAVEGAVVSHPIEVCNLGPDDVIELTATSSQGWGLSLHSDPDCDGVADALLAVDRRGDGTWDVVDSGDTDLDGTPDTGLLPTGSCACFVLDVEVPNRVDLFTVDRVSVAATGDGGGTDTLELTTTIRVGLELFPDHLLVLGTGRTSGPGRSVYFPHVARNNWAVADRVDLTITPPVNDAGWEVRFWSDPDRDGNVRDGSRITVTEPVPPNGGELGLVVEVRVPEGVGEGAASATAVTGTSELDVGVDAAVTDELEVSALSSHSDPGFLVPATIFPPCAAIYVKGTGLARPAGSGDDDRYDLAWFDAAPASIRFVDSFLPDSNGEATDVHVAGTDDVPGAWRLELLDETLPLATLALTVEANGDVEQLATDRPVYFLNGSDLAVDVRLRNGNTEAPFVGTSVEYVVLDPQGGRYLVSGATSTFADRDAGQVTRRSELPALAATEAAGDPFTVPNVSYPGEGTYLLEATWRASCGTVLATASTSFSVGAGEDCTDGIDNDGDGQVDCDDVECRIHPACTESECTDGLDDDGDGRVDCDDEDCSDDPTCLPESDCADGLDDDLDGAIDCADSDCAASPDCPESDCGNGVDDDADGQVDCDDLDCAGEVRCQPESRCGDGLDDDGDGAVDCDDPDCTGSPDCREVACGNAVDDDGDGAADCDDPDCLATVADCDADGVVNDVDCDPADPAVTLAPPEVSRLDVARQGQVAWLRWAGVAPAAGSGTVHEVITGVLSELRRDGGFDRAECLVRDEPAERTSDPRLIGAGSTDGLYYLVRGVNDCGSGAFGTSGLGGSRTVPAGTCG